MDSCSFYSLFFFFLCRRRRRFWDKWRRFTSGMPTESIDYHYYILLYTGCLALGRVRGAMSSLMRERTLSVPRNGLRSHRGRILRSIYKNRGFPRHVRCLGSHAGFRILSLSLLSLLFLLHKSFGILLRLLRRRRCCLNPSHTLLG